MRRLLGLLGQLTRLAEQKAAATERAAPPRWNFCTRAFRAFRRSAQLKEDIATLAQEVADLQKGLNEETEVRNEESYITIDFVYNSVLIILY